MQHVGISLHSRELSLRAAADSTQSMDATLAGDYVVGMKRQTDGTPEKTIWSLYRIDDVIDEPEPESASKIWTDGTRAVEALEVVSNSDSLSSMNAQVTLSCYQNERDRLELFCEGQSVDKDLILLLQLLQSQWVASHQSSQASQNSDVTWRVSVDGSNDIFYGSLKSRTGLEHIFLEALDIDPTTMSAMEWVEMMTGNSHVIGMLPRPLVHKYNLLHRGIGVFVTKDRPIDLDASTSSKDFPDVYVHQRVASKRIFPSLYDMFVGGVSGANEPSEVTAQREVAEELGLSKALSTPLSKWSGGRPMLTCLVCTAYNRCLVDLYQYVMDTREETISWQKEEVAWGSFVSYNTIMAAADLSIQRAAAEKSWPGSYPPIQSELRGKLQEGMEEEKYKSWKEWEFVPDGLLVWNAWLEYLSESQVNQKAIISS
jgi:8-oxo-dGTP pyrophosphatase MutT (NUDIX family)